MQPTITFFCVSIVDFSISIDTEFTNSGSFPNFKTFRNLYCIALCSYKQTLRLVFEDESPALYSN